MENGVVTGTVSDDALRVAGDLDARCDDIVPAVERRGDSHIRERADHGSAESCKVQPRVIGGGRHEREIHVAEVVIDRAAARYPADDGDIVFFRICPVDLRPRVLIFTDDHGGAVLPEHKSVAVCRRDEKFVRRDIEIGVDRVVSYRSHHPASFFIYDTTDGGKSKASGGKYAHKKVDGGAERRAERDRKRGGGESLVRGGVEEKEKGRAERRRQRPSVRYEHIAKRRQIPDRGQSSRREVYHHDKR